MKLVGYGVIFGAIWLWAEQPLAMAVMGGIVTGGVIGYGLGLLNTPKRAPTTVLEAQGDDPALARLLGMGFRPEEVAGPLAKARAEGVADPVGYVMGVLIR